MTERSALDLSICLVADAALCDPRGVASVVGAAVDGGVRSVLLRDTDADDADLLPRLAELADVIGGRAALLVADRVDVAVVARERGIRVDGVHLGRDDAAVREARERLGDDAILGLTATSPAHLSALRRMPRGTVDYVGVGVIHHTTTKADHAPALGVDGFARFAAEAELPCVAFGGIELGDVRPLRDAGAAGVALASAICATRDPRAVAAAFSAEWAAR